MKTLLLVLALSLAGCAVNSVQVSGGPAATVRYSEGKSGGALSAAVLVNDAWEYRAFYFGQQRIYDGLLKIEPYWGVAASKVWTFRDGKLFRPYLSMGVMLKESQRCTYNGDVDCNRLTPLSWCLLPRAGFYLGDAKFELGHCSNNSMDWGPEKKNLGQDYLGAEIVVKRW